MVHAGAVEPRPDHWRGSLVLLLAHGSEATPGASDLVKKHAHAIKSQCLFADVQAVFLRDTPLPRDLIDRSQHDDIYIVPFMISEGYSIEVLIPQALGLAGPLTERISEQGRRRIHVCHSIGTHDLVEQHIVSSINELVATENLSTGDTCALVIAHGTKRHPGNNQQSTHLAARIADRCHVREAHAVFLEEPPFIGDWQSLTSSETVLALPYLMTMGSHATHDVPVALGIQVDDQGFYAALLAGETYGPTQCQRRQLWYAPVIGNLGTIPAIVEDRIRHWDSVHHG
jgi:sirohydrochlorin ferrochelatase